MQSFLLHPATASSWRLSSTRLETSPKWFTDIWGWAEHVIYGSRQWNYPPSEGKFKRRALNITSTRSDCLIIWYNHSSTRAWRSWDFNIYDGKYLLQHCDYALQQIKPEEYGNIFRNSLEPDVLHNILRTLRDFYLKWVLEDALASQPTYQPCALTPVSCRNEGAAITLEVLRSLARVGRFNMAVMFMSSAEKKGGVPLTCSLVRPAMLFFSPSHRLCLFCFFPSRSGLRPVWLPLPGWPGSISRHSLTEEIRGVTLGFKSL